MDHFSGWGLVVLRGMGIRPYMKHRCFGINYTIRREQAGMANLPCPGPGGPVVKRRPRGFLHAAGLELAVLGRGHADDLSVHAFLRAVRRIRPRGLRARTPENCKRWNTKNVWRRIYPGVMGIHGGVFYNARTEQWIAITCRRPHVGYILNIADAGRGVCYDFTLHGPFAVGQWMRMPEIKLI